MNQRDPMGLFDEKQEHPAGKAPDLSIVIVDWNNIKYLEPCLESIYAAQSKIQFELVVVDNGSEDGSQEMLKQKYPQVRIIQNASNAGLSRASNQGIRETGGRYVLLYNNDTLMEPGTLDRMVEFMDAHPDAGAAGGRLVNPDGFQSSYSRFPRLWNEFLNTTRLAMLGNPFYPSFPDSQVVQIVDWIMSACLVLRRSALDEIGLLDEQYFIYGDEMELQYRLKREGWKVYFLPFISTVHYGGVSLNRFRIRRLYYRGVVMFFDTHRGNLKTLLLRFILLMVALLKIVYWSIMQTFTSSKQKTSAEISSNKSILRMCLTGIKEIRAEYDTVLQLSQLESATPPT